MLHFHSLDHLLKNVNSNFFHMCIQCLGHHTFTSQDLIGNPFLDHCHISIHFFVNHVIQIIFHHRIDPQKMKKFFFKILFGQLSFQNFKSFPMRLLDFIQKLSPRRHHGEIIITCPPLHGIIIISRIFLIQCLRRIIDFSTSGPKCTELGADLRGGYQSGSISD